VYDERLVDTIRSSLLLKINFKIYKLLQQFKINIKREDVSKVIKNAKQAGLNGQTCCSHQSSGWSASTLRDLLRCQMGIENVC